MNRLPTTHRRRVMITALLASCTASWAIAGGVNQQGADAADTARQTAENTPSKDGLPTVEALFASLNQLEGTQESDTERATNRPPPAVAATATFPETLRPAETHAASQRWLRTSTSAASAEVARRLIAQATEEYKIAAWASAETSAWEALRWAAESVELAARERDATSPAALGNLQIARTAIREARDFSGYYGLVDEAAIRRMARSHCTTVLDSQPLGNLSSADAVDRYLDEARVRLSVIAAASVEAAQAMDLLAAIHLGRADAKTLPSSTALCLRRAALQGQPKNASLALRLGMHLADLGLNHEAAWALRHSYRLQPSRAASDALVALLRRSGNLEEASRLAAGSPPMSDQSGSANVRVPTVETLSPEQFASISQPVVPASRRGNIISGTLASAKRNLVRVVDSRPEPTEREVERTAEPEDGQQSTAGPPTLFRRIIGSLIPAWR